MTSESSAVFHISGTGVQSPTEAFSAATQEISVGADNGYFADLSAEDRELAIYACLADMVATSDRDIRRAYWITIKRLIDSRPQAEKDAMEAARMARVGL